MSLFGSKSKPVVLDLRVEVRERHPALPAVGTIIPGDFPGQLQVYMQRGLVSPVLKRDKNGKPTLDKKGRLQYENAGDWAKYGYNVDGKPISTK